MCGFIFCTRKDNILLKNKFSKAANLISHRGPDHEASFEDKHVFFKFFRLSIQDISLRAMQPMHDSTGRYLIVFNGEIYNANELKKKIKFNRYKSSSDTEILLYFIIEKGISYLAEVEGMFSFILYDKYKKAIFIARDRFGIKPLYFSKIKSDFYFSSEIKPLLFLNKKNHINDNAFLDFFLKGSMDHNEKTFFDKVNSVGPGHFGFIDGQNLILKKYWNLCDQKSKYTNFVNSKNELKSKLFDGVLKHLKSDRKLGLFLSGGTDSTTLLNLIIEQIKEGSSIETFTYGFKGSGQLDEVSRVDNLIKKIKIKNYLINLTPNDVIKKFENISIILESPFTSIRVFAMKKLYKLANQLDYKVILEGDGGDELFGGYDYNFLPYLNDLYNNKPEKDKLIANKLKYFAKLKKKNKDYISDLLITNNYQYGSTSDGTPFINIDFFNKDYLDRNIDEQFFNSNNEKNLNYLQNSQYKDISSIKLPRSLKYKDRISMSEGIECRIPLLHHPFAEYAFFLPNNYKFNKFETRYIFKEISRDIKKNKIKYALTKNTIVDPQTNWLKTTLKEFFLDNIGSIYFKNLGYFNQKKIIESFYDFCKNKNAKSSFVYFQVLSFMQFKKAFKRFNV